MSCSILPLRSRSHRSSSRLRGLVLLILQLHRRRLNRRRGWSHLLLVLIIHNRVDLSNINETLPSLLRLSWAHLLLRRGLLHRLARRRPGLYRLRLRSSNRLLLLLLGSILCLLCLSLKLLLLLLYFLLRHLCLLHLFSFHSNIHC